jgi:hypothetical protein
MFFTVNDGKVVDPRDLEATPDMFAGPAPVKLEKELAVPTFGAVDRQDQARSCYICGRSCPEIATFPRKGEMFGTDESYVMFLHRWCWWYSGGGMEQEKLSRSAR